MIVLPLSIRPLARSVERSTRSTTASGTPDLDAMETNRRPLKTLAEKSSYPQMVRRWFDAEHDRPIDPRFRQQLPALAIRRQYLRRPASNQIVIRTR